MIQVALVGLGDIGLGAHLPALLRHPKAQVAALVDPDPGRRAIAEELAGGEPLVSGDLVDALDAGVRAVVLATPPWVTPRLAVQALQQGCFVLAEKPVATSAEAAAVYERLGEAERRRLQVGLTYRHDPALQLLAGRLREGRLGTPLLARAHIYDERHDPADPAHAERIRRTLAHGTPVVHEGAHVLDWLAFLLGAQTAAVADAWALRTDSTLPAANLTGARLAYPGGHVALVEFGWLTGALPRCELTFLGPSGVATLDGRSFRLELTTGAGTEVVELPGERVARCFDLQLDRFTDLVTGGLDRPEPDLADGLAALRTAEQIAALAAEQSQPSPQQAAGQPALRRAAHSGFTP